MSWDNLELDDLQIMTAKILADVEWEINDEKANDRSNNNDKGKNAIPRKGANLNSNTTNKR